MKRPTVASLKKVTPENLAKLGAERLAEILASAAEARPELKRRLRMELAAEQGAEHLLLEIDKRLGFLDTSRSKVSWRQRPTFVRDFAALRALIVERLAALDRKAALERMWLFMDLARPLSLRVRDKHGDLAAVFDEAARDLGLLLADAEPPLAADALVAALARAPARWAEWLPAVLESTPPVLAEAALARIGERPAGAWPPLARLLADAAGDVAAYRATWREEQLKTPGVAAAVAQRLLAAGDVEGAGRLLEAAAPKPKGRAWIGGKGAAEPDFDWESAWIDYLQASGQAEAAQTARWASFERTLSAERARAFTRQLGDFDDVEAEHRAFEIAAGHADFERGLSLLMDWPAYPEAARMIAARPDDIEVDDELAQAWAAKLRVRYPAAAHALLRKAAAAAFRRRDFATCDRLTQEAETIAV